MSSATGATESQAKSDAKDAPQHPATAEAKSEAAPAATSVAPSERMLTAALWAVSIFAAVYLLQGALHLPGLLYDPAARRWLVDTSTSGVQMRYYSDLLGAGLAALAAALLRLRWRRPAADLSVLTGSALALVLLDLSFFLSRILTALRK